MTHQTINLDVPVIGRVEGEGALHVGVRDREITDLRLEIYEAPRFFEALLVGRAFGESVDITARICGICPVAYQMSATHAMENLMGVAVGGQLRALRRLLYCGEWIESHVLHIAFLHAPDFLGLPSGIAIAREHPEVVEMALALKKLGNDLVEVVGGRPIHPVNVAVGGFYRAPEVGELQALLPRIEWARTAAEQLVRWTASFDFPDLEADHELVSLRHETEYPMCEGQLVSDRGLDIDVASYEDTFEEFHIAHSTALHSRVRERGRYLTGPLARWANNHDRLPAPVADLAADVGVGPIERNPFRSIVIRSLEVLYAVAEAERIVHAYVRPESPRVPITPRAGRGFGCTEAPRGSLYHRYDTDDEGLITAAVIVPPTAQNQPSIEADLRALVTSFVAQDQTWTEAAIDRLRHECEMAIRNHDPCISCATHFLTVTVDEA